MTVRIGLVGAGSCTAMVPGPMLAAGLGTTMARIWARRPVAAGELGERLGVPVAASYEELMDACDAVAFAVPPDVRTELAPVAAAGRHPLLEKQLAFTVEGTERISAAAEAAGCSSLSNTG